ncbi:MAG: Ig-like domain-containing protein [Gemmatimonadales bacterium]|nr:Ig-like domain-containing protein [Gemmatimonadales bacterium]
MPRARIGHLCFASQFAALAATLVALSIAGCGGGGDLGCGGPFCVVPPGQQQATRLRAGAGDGQVGSPGNPLPQRLEVIVTDEDDRPIPDVTVGFSTVAGDGSLSSDSATSDYQGRAGVMWTLGSEPGAQSVRATAEGSAGTPLEGSPISFSAQAVRSPVTKLVIRQTPPATVRNGAPFDRQPIVAAVDADGAPVPGLPITASIASGGGTLEGGVTVATDSTGLATYTDLAISGNQGSRTLRFALAEPALDVLSGPVAVAAGTLARLTGNEPSRYTGVVGSPVSPPPAVLARDGAGNPVAGALVSFAADNGALVSPATVPTDSLGIARVTSWTLGSSTGSPYTLTARVQSGGGDPVRFTATAVAGAAGRLEVTVQPSSSARSGSVFARQPAVQVVDRLGNPAPAAGVRVTASLATGPAGTLTGVEATTNASGLATFSGLGLEGLVGDYVLSFSAPDLAGISSDRLSLAAGPARRIALVAPLPSEARSRIRFPTQPIVQLYDAAGNPVGLAGVFVRASLASGAGELGGDTGTTTDANGRATFADLMIVGAPGTHTLRFASTDPTSDVVSGAVTLPAAVAIAMVTDPPASAAVGTMLASPATWSLVDAANLPVPDVPARLTPSAGGAVEPSGITSDGDGALRLGSWTLGTVAGTQTVDLAVDGGLSARVQTVAVADVAAAIEKVSGDGQTAPVSSELPDPLVVRITDRFGNGVSGVTVQWRTCDNVGDYDAVTDANGFASAFQSTGAEVGTFCVQGAVEGLTGSPVQFSITATGPGASESPPPDTTAAPLETSR